MASRNRFAMSMFATAGRLAVLAIAAAVLGGCPGGSSPSKTTSPNTTVSIAGTAPDTAGTSFSSATVTALDVKDGRKYGDDGSIRVQSSNTFEIDEVEPDRYYLIVITQGSKSVTQLVFVPDNGQPVVDVGAVDPATRTMVRIAEHHLTRVFGAGFTLENQLGAAGQSVEEEIDALDLDAELERIRLLAAGVSPSGLTDEVRSLLLNGGADADTGLLSEINLYLLVSAAIEAGDESAAAGVPDSLEDWEANDSVAGVPLDATEVEVDLSVNVAVTVHRTNLGTLLDNCVDHLPPSFANVPADMTVEAEGPGGADVAYTAPTANDLRDGSTAVACLPDSGDTFPLGTSTVTCSTADGAGNTASVSFDVTVEDTTPPVVTVPLNVTREAPAPTTPAFTGQATAADVVDPAPTIGFSDATVAGTGQVVQIITRTWTATDASGNSATADQIITTVDTTEPVLSGVPADITTPATGPSGAVVNYTEPTAVDAVDGAVTPVCIPASGSTFPLGTTPVTCTATDAHTNFSDASFSVTVEDAADSTPPSNTTSPDFIDGGSASTDSITLTLALSATDDVGVTGYFVEESPSPTPSGAPAPDAVGWTAVTATTSYNAGVSYDLTATPAEGSDVYVHVWFRDAADHVSTVASDGITWSDGEDPVNITGADFINGGLAQTANQVVSLSVSATDNVGVTGVFVVDNDTGVEPTAPGPNDAGWGAVATPSTDYSDTVFHTFSQPYIAGTTVHVYVWVKDAAGHVSAVATDSIVFMPVISAVFSDNFEGGWGDWFPENGVWDIGTPDPALAPTTCDSGVTCAGTVLNGPYPDVTDSRLVSPPIPLPALAPGDNLLLSFREWFSIASGRNCCSGTGDSGVVQVQEETGPGTWSPWTTVGGKSYSSGGWTKGQADLSAFASKRVRLGFLLENGTNSSPAAGAGWYLDDVEVRVVPTIVMDPAEVLAFGFEGGIEDFWASNGIWQAGLPTVGPAAAYTGTGAAGTILDGNYPDVTTSYLVSPPIELPALLAGEDLLLSFREWFSIASGRNCCSGTGDSGVVQVQEETSPGTWGPWTTVGGKSYSSGGWTKGQADLSGFAGTKVRFGFELSNGDNSAPANATGWYLDDVELSVVPTIVMDPAEVLAFGFEGGIEDFWASNGIWQAGLPTVGPAAAYTGTGAAGTILDGNYPDVTTSYLVSPPIELPALLAGEDLLLSFREWFSIASGRNCCSGTGDSGVVQVQEETSPGTWGPWTTVGGKSYSSGGWTKGQADLSGFAGTKVRFGFELSNGDNSAPANATGWYLDDVELSVEQTTVLAQGETFEYAFETGIGMFWATNGVWQAGTPTVGPLGAYSGTGAAGTVLDGNYPDITDSRLVTPALDLTGIALGNPINLRYREWFSIASGRNCCSGTGDAGYVQVQEETSPGIWGGWIAVGPTKTYDSGGWSFPLVDLAGFAEKKIRIGFLLDNGDNSSPPAMTGWYIDELTVTAP